MDKKGVELSINVVIISVIAILVLVVLIYFVYTAIIGNKEAISCAELGGICKDSCVEPTSVALPDGNGACQVGGAVQVCCKLST